MLNLGNVGNTNQKALAALVSKQRAFQQGISEAIYSFSYAVHPREGGTESWAYIVQEKLTQAVNPIFSCEDQ